MCPITKGIQLGLRFTYFHIRFTYIIKFYIRRQLPHFLTTHYFTHSDLGLKVFDFNEIWLFQLSFRLSSGFPVKPGIRCTVGSGGQVPEVHSKEFCLEHTTPTQKCIKDKSYKFGVHISLLSGTRATPSDQLLYY